jgi:hypothetical protein
MYHMRLSRIVAGAAAARGARPDDGQPGRRRHDHHPPARLDRHEPVDGGRPVLGLGLPGGDEPQVQPEVRGDRRRRRLCDLRARQQHQSAFSEKCLVPAPGVRRPFAAFCNPASASQQCTRGFVNDGRIGNRSTLTALTRQPNGVVEMRFLGGGQVGQSWHEHPPGRSAGDGRARAAVTRP